jgi:ketosteroid isomerase-like protein
MTNTSDTVRQYLAAFAAGGDWRSFLDDDLVFESRVAGAGRRVVRGREAYLASTARFLGMVRGVEPVRIVADGDGAAVLSAYALEAPDGTTFTSDVAEFLRVADGRITELVICFDTAPYPRPVPEG